MLVTVLQWNVWFRENVDNVLKFLSTHPADIICLQELTRGYIEQSQENTWEYLAHSLGYNYRVQEIPIITAQAQWSQANGIFSKYPIKTQNQTWLHWADDTNDRDQYRGYLEATLDVEGTALTVGNTHMSFAETAHDEETKRLAEMIDQASRPYILTADLNALADSPRVSELSKLLKHAGPALDQNTWPTKFFNFNGSKVPILSKRLDYIFTSPELKTIKAEILKTSVSDHLPVLATLELVNP